MAKNRRQRQAARGEIRPIRPVAAVEIVGWRQMVESGLEAVRDAEQSLRDAVAEARFEGASWSELGAVLGVSRQAAHERFGAAHKS